MKKRYFLIISVLITWVLTGPGLAGQFTMSTYTPSPMGTFDTFRLLPRASLGDLGDDCAPVGLLYVEDAAGQMRYCKDDGTGSGKWGLLSGVFTQKDNYIFPADTDINPDLRLGIGTTAPEECLHVAGGNGLMISSDAPEIILNDDDAGDADMSLYVDNSVLHFQSDVSGTFDDLAVVTSAGNVGFGQSAPQATLHSTGNELITGNELRIKGDTPSMYFEHATDTDMRVSLKNGILTFEADGNGVFEDQLRISGESGGVWLPYNIRIKGLETMLNFADTITNSYWKLVNTRDTNFVFMTRLVSDSSYKSKLKIDETFKGFTVQNNGSGPFVKISPEGPTWLYFDRATITAAQDRIYDNNTGARLGSDGKWYNGSSRRIKKNIKPLDAQTALSAFKKLEPVSFNYKADKDDPTLGFISEDVPDLVATESRKTLSPMDIVGVLTKVIQWQKEKLEAQQQMIQQQHEEIKTIEQRLNTL